MTQEIEIEFKNLLTQPEFNQLFTYLTFPVTPDEQTNYYFETANFDLKSSGAALRIRQKNRHYTLTLKETHPQGLLETHDVLTETEATQWLNGNIAFKVNTGRQLRDIGIEPGDLVLFGNLTTRRWEIAYDQTLVVLDQSFYQGKEDFELEVEGSTRKEASAVFNELLSKADIPHRTTPNKIKRLFNELMSD